MGKEASPLRRCPPVYGTWKRLRLGLVFLFHISLSLSLPLFSLLPFESLLLLFLWWELKRGKPHKNGGLRLQAAATWMNCADSLKCSRVRYNIPSSSLRSSRPTPVTSTQWICCLVDSRKIKWDNKKKKSFSRMSEIWEFIGSTFRLF